MSSRPISSIIVFGITGGIGLEVFRQLDIGDVKIMGYYNDNDNLARTLAASPRVRIQKANLNFENLTETLELPNYEAMVYAVGVPFFSDGLFQFQEQDAREQLNLSVFSLLNLIRALINVRDSQLRKVVVVGSRPTTESRSIYHLFKRLQTAMLRELEPELSRRGVSTSIIQAGWVATRMYDRFVERTKALGQDKGNRKPLDPKIVAQICVEELQNSQPLTERNIT